MNPFLAIARGIRAAAAPRALVALGWIYGLLAALAAGLTFVVYTVVSGGVANSSVASTLRSGMSPDWLLDTFAQPGGGAKTVAVLLLAVMLAVVYAAVSVALSGGAVSRVLGALAGSGSSREPFLAECGRYAGPMLRVALIEIVFLTVVGGVLVIVWVGGLAGGAGNTFAWISVGVMALALAVITGMADVARVHVVATENRSAVAAWRDALSHGVRRAPVFLILVLFNLAVAATVAWIALTMHGTIPRETGPGVLIGLAVGQVCILGRIWVRIVALATQASLWRMAA